MNEELKRASDEDTQLKTVTHNSQSVKVCTSVYQLCSSTKGLWQVKYQEFKNVDALLKETSLDIC